MKSLFYLNKYFYKYRYRLLLGLLFIIISNFFLILPAPIIRNALDYVAESKNNWQEGDQHIFMTKIIWFGVQILGAALLRGVFLFFVRQSIIVVSRLIEYDLKNEVYQHYQTLPLSFYRKNNTGDLMARISEDVSRVRMYLGPAVMYGLNLFVLFFMVIPYMFSINVKLTLYVLLPLPVLSLSIYFVNNIINQKSEEIQRSLSGLSTYVQEAFSGIRILKAFVREQSSSANFNTESEFYKNKSLSLVKVNALFFPLIMSLIGLSTILVVYIGGAEVIQGTLKAGNIAEFILYVNMLIWPVTSLGWISSIIQRAAASQKRINEFLQFKTNILSIKNLKPEINGALHFSNVYFTYPDTGIKILNGISFSVAPNETIAILGATGVGKTTIANLLTRLYDCDKGVIYVDGTNIKDIDINYLRKSIGYVPQDVFLFSDTIKNNIGFGMEQINEEDIYDAAQMAHVYHNIIDFPKKFETFLGERGITLSGGQKQRVSIARAIIRNPKILILDDALSAVDTKTESLILDNLKQIMKNKTTIIISHRVSSAKLADKIIVLDNGHIVQEGRHEDLIMAEGFYKNLYLKQLEGV